MIGGTGVYFFLATDKRSGFDTGDVFRVGSCQKRAGAFFRIQRNERAGVDQFLTNHFIFGFGSVAPINGVDLNQRIPELEETPVLCAALLNKPKTLRKLLDLGASVHVTSKQGTPLVDIVSRRSDKITPEIRTLICQAVQKEPALITSSIPCRQAISPDHTRV